MATERAGGCELTKLVTDHILGYVNRNVLSAVMHSDRVADIIFIMIVMNYRIN